MICEAIDISPVMNQLQLYEMNSSGIFKQYFITEIVLSAVALNIVSE